MTAKSRKTGLFLREFKKQLITTVVAVVLAVLAYFLVDNQLTLLWITLLITVVALMIMIWLIRKDRDFYFVPLEKHQDKANWIGRGGFEFTETDRCFVVNNADPGYIYPKCLTWSNYLFSVEFKILSSCLGLIVRAVNLSNYVMMQINPSGIRPHIRVNGAWRPWEHQDVGLSFENDLSLDEWYKADIRCENRSINIKIFSRSGKVFDRTWDVPQGSLSFQFKENPESTTAVDIPFPINLEYGSVGFRNAHREKALIRNVFIEKI